MTTNNELPKDLSHIKGVRILKVGDFVKVMFGWIKVTKVENNFNVEGVFVSDEEKEQADPNDKRICAHTGEW